MDDEMSDQEEVPGEEGIDAQMSMGPDTQVGAMPPDPQSPVPGMNMDMPMTPDMGGIPGAVPPTDPLMTGGEMQPPPPKKMIQFMSKKGKIQFMAKDAPKRIKDVFQHCMLKM